MKLFRSSLFGTLAVIAFSVLGIAQSVETDFDRAFDLANLKTFSFAAQDRRPGDPLVKSPLNDRSIHDALESQLKLRGLITSENPDFRISYFVSTHTGFDIQDNRTGVFQKMGSLNVSQVTEGSLVVIFTDTATNKEAWRGFATGVIAPKDLDKDVNKAIAKLVDKFVKNQAGKK